MTYRQILNWAKKWHYPGLVLDGDACVYLPHGKQHYQGLLHDKQRRDRAALRIERWNARVAATQKERVSA